MNCFLRGMNSQVRAKAQRVDENDLRWQPSEHKLLRRGPHQYGARRFATSALDVTRHMPDPEERGILRAADALAPPGPSVHDGAQHE